MLAATRLTYRINRFEVAAVLIATVLSVAVSALIILWITTSGYSACIVTDGSLTVQCLELEGIGQWATRIASMSMNLAVLFPVLAGILLGVPIISRELDRGTARLAWSLSPSRLRWYVQRLLPMVILIAAAAFTIGVVAERLTALFAPNVDLANSFVGFRGRGVLLATSALVFGSAAVVVGAVIGRQMPTLVLAIVLAGLSLLAVGEVHKRVMAGEAVPHVGDNFDGNSYEIDYRFRYTDGRLLTWEELVVVDPSVMNEGPNYEFVALEIPAARYREVETREALAHVSLSAIFLVAGGVVVGRRRPG